MTTLRLDPADPMPAAQAVLAAAERATAHDPELVERVEQARKRLEGPLRVAIAGKVKAGKSTLVNAFLADDLAPTDAGECTMVTTWFQHGAVPATRVVGKDGVTRELAFRRRGGHFVMGLGGLDLDEVARVEVDWPSPFLRNLTLIDTPGIDSLTTEASDRTTGFLLGRNSSRSGGGAPGRADVDAVIYLMRHRHSVDLTFVSELARSASDAHGAATTLVVLSRADELGGGRIDSLVSARDIATAYADEPLLRAHSVGVVPVAGLLAHGSRMLRQDDVDLMSSLAGVTRDDREAMLISADRYASHGQGGTPAQRRALVRRLGLFGIRMGAALIRQGHTSAAGLAQELEHHSGLAAVVQVLEDHFLPRSRLLIGRNLADAMELLADECPEPGARELREACDRFRIAAEQGLSELGMLLRLRSEEFPGLDDRAIAEAARILGGKGTPIYRRLGLAPDSDSEDVVARWNDLVERWRAVAEDAGGWRSSRRLARSVIAALDLMAVIFSSPVDLSATT